MATHKGWIAKVHPDGSGVTIHVDDGTRGTGRSVAALFEHHPQLRGLPVGTRTTSTFPEQRPIEIDFGMPSYASIEADARERARVEAGNRFRAHRNAQWDREIDSEQAAKAAPAQPAAKRTLRYGSKVSR
jgi:hypothetical protein